jgi:DNA-binding SARP family transcriptional activator/tetratricopeptide (TPR) repeat protein
LTLLTGRDYDGRMLHARLFGPLRISVDSDAAPEVPGLRPRAVLAWLVMHPGLHPRETVAARFWPNVLDTSARGSLRSALWVVRASLETVGAADYLVGDRDRVGIAPELPRSVDLEDAIAFSSGDVPGDWERAFGLMADPLLSDLTDDWVLEARDDYRVVGADLARRIAASAEADGRIADAVTWTRRALARDRLDEATHRLLISRLAAAGEGAQALAAYERCQAILRAEFGTLPSEETRALARSVRADAASVAAPVPRRATADHPNLIGRRESLATLEAAWQRARSGAGGVAIVAGPAGIGKTRLVDELVARVSPETLVVRGVAAEVDGAPPLAPWSEALDALANTVRPPPDTPWTPDLARLSIRIEEAWDCPPGAPAATPEIERIRLFDAVLECLRWAGTVRPVLLVLEDVHLLDTTSAALVAHVGRRLTDVRVLMVVTSRPDDAPAVLDALAWTDVPPVRVGLTPLDDAESRQLAASVAPALSSDGREEVAARCDGNPLLVVQAARAGAAGTDVSEDLRGWIRPTLARLPGSARQLVDIGAAAGRPLDLGEVAACVGPEHADAAIDAAYAAGLLCDVPGRRLRFTHSLVREACYAELGAGRRTWAHRRFAEVLEDRPHQAPSELARHLLLAGEDERARDLLARAAAQAREIGALDEAAGYLREAARLAEESPGRAAELWLELAVVEAWRADRAAVDDAFRNAVDALEAIGDRRGLASAWAQQALLLWTTLCYPREAAAAYQRCLELLGKTTNAPEIRVLAMAGQAKAEALIGDPRRAARMADAVDARVSATDDPALAAEVAGARLFIAIRGEDGTPRAETADHAITLARAAGRTELAYVTAITTASALAARGDLPGAMVYIDRALESGQAGASLTSQAHAARAFTLLRLGRVDEADRAIARSTEIAEGSQDPILAAVAHFDAGTIALLEDRPAIAARELQTALRNQGGRFSRALGQIYLAEALVQTGDLDGAGDAIARVPFEQIGPADLPATLVPRLTRVQGLIAAARGDLGLADRRLAEAEEGWSRLQGTIDIGDAYTAVIVDLGRPPVAGLVEISDELARVQKERARLAARAAAGSPVKTVTSGGVPGA